MGEEGGCYVDAWVVHSPQDKEEVQTRAPILLATENLYGFLTSSPDLRTSCHCLQGSLRGGTSPSQIKRSLIRGEETTMS